MRTCVTDLKANLCRYNIKKYYTKRELNFPVASLKETIFCKLNITVIADKKKTRQINKLKAGLNPEQF